MAGKPSTSSRGRGTSAWQVIAVLVVIILVPWALYVNFHPRFASTVAPPNDTPSNTVIIDTTPVVSKPTKNVAKEVNVAPPKPLRRLPVLGPEPVNGTKPIHGAHTGRDAIFALACKYPVEFYRRFVGSLRKFGYSDDIVLAVSPPTQMAPGVEDYIIQTNVVAYAFDVDCKGKDDCKLKDDFLGYPDPRPHRTFANIRYALYEYWMRHYTPQSYVLILDFRDTFFQANPFNVFGAYENRKPNDYALHVFAENHKVKTIGNCVFNSMWVGRCFGEAALIPLKKEAVICSGSTLGSYAGINHYIATMLRSMDEVQCWRKGIESDQGYQSYLFYNGFFNTKDGNATKFDQGNGVVNTIGAMNGYR